MKQSDLRTALQGSLREPPEGFDARSEQKLVTLLSREEHKVKKIPGLVIAVALMLIVSMATALAASLNEDVNRLLYQVWPAAARALRPVNLSMENAGVRLDVLSASVNDNSMYVTFALTDLEGDRFDENTKCEGSLSGACCQSSWGHTELLSYDPAARQAVFVGYTQYIPQPYSVIALNSNDYLDLCISGISTPETTEIDNLLSFMEGKDYAPEAAPCRDRHMFSTGFSIEDDVIPEITEYPPILNPENSLEIPLAEGFTLSGIGWIDGIMHVQVHMPHCVKEISSEHSFSHVHLATCDVSLLDENEEWVSYGPGSQYPFGIHTMGWTDRDDAWMEFLFPWSREEMKQYHLHGTFTNKAKYPELLEHDWYVDFPASMIQPEAEK